MINAFVDSALLNGPFWVRQEDGEPPTKARKTHPKVEVKRHDIMTLLRPPLQGNPNRKDELKVFFDFGFYRMVKGLLDQDYAVGYSKYCMVSTSIGVCSVSATYPLRISNDF